MEPGELLKVNIEPYDSESYQDEEFLAKMTSDGRLTIPKLTMEVLKQREEKNLTGAILEVTINPTGALSDVAADDKAATNESAEKEIIRKIKDIRKTRQHNLLARSFL
jgi:bifunctional DNA-binding transcriptional regulator/antitoxin component of YhaV-PrlF toxin-antitoxin module